MRRPADVAHVERDGVVFVAKLPSGPIQVLEGSARVIWQEAQTGERLLIADRVATRTGVPANEIVADVESFVQLLVSLGILAEHDDTDPAPYRDPAPSI